MKVERIEGASHRASAREDLTSLFIAYRQFSGGTGDEGEATSFIRRRLQISDSIIWNDETFLTYRHTLGGNNA
jgi:hypothetical protein